MSTTQSADTAPTKPLRALPGSYGIPFFSPIKDRLQYYYSQGQDNFFKTRADEYKSTVFRTNMPPGPFMAKDPRVVCLLDALSFQVLFDLSKVEKRDLFTGTFMPPTSLTGDYRVCAYLDPSEPKHAMNKKLLFSLLADRHKHFLPAFHDTFSKFFDGLDAAVGGEKKEADFNALNDVSSFDFCCRAYFGVDPASTSLGTAGPKMVSKWLLFNLHPLMVLGLPKVLEEIFLHTFHLPPFLVKSDYKKIYDFFYSAAADVLDRAESIGLEREEACHNILFATCFNSYGGFKVFFPDIFKWLALAEKPLHKRLREEIRSVVKAEGGAITMAGLEKMELTKSVVYETLRIEPPVMFQYGKAKKDFVLESHDSSFEIKKGEMLFGYQPFATKDPKVFADAEKFVPDRFVGDGAGMLKYVYWSNGRETDAPTEGNKQCPAKDFVVLMGRLLVVEFFMRYDSFEATLGTILLGPKVTITSLTKATS
ncbi:Allene oxide synthase [Acorus gramineus]|uniref:Allene oxide synthase n=1 Tax=Acorus gramineus TaxID=55184 RepID=A0AAV9BIZ1_ACOGR|nr:Allene oxide synthase [Acorus gramineus]